MIEKIRKKVAKIVDRGKTLAQKASAEYPRQYHLDLLASFAPKLLPSYQNAQYFLKQSDIHGEMSF
jgi:hypothetical protein